MKTTSNWGRCSALVADTDLLCFIWGFWTASNWEFDHRCDEQKAVVSLFHVSRWNPARLALASVCRRRLKSCRKQVSLPKSLCLPQLLRNSLDAVCSVDFSFLALLSHHVANSKCHPLLFEVFKERVCVSECAECKEGMEDESTRTICCCRLRMEWWVVT